MLKTTFFFNKQLFVTSGDDQQPWTIQSSALPESIYMLIGGAILEMCWLWAEKQRLHVI